jgi:signal peptidase I
MALGRSYQLTDVTLRELKEAGLAEGALEALRSQNNGRVYRTTEFQELLARLGDNKVSQEDRRVIQKFARLSLLRLERFIPNRGLREWVDALVFALVIAAIVRTFIVAPFKIPSGSMIPTILVGDHIFATMFSYGVPVPFTHVKLFPEPIQRQDVVIFPFPGDPSVDYIKRVIAKGGETVMVRGTEVFIDGKPLSEPYAYYDPGILQAYRRNSQTPPDFGPVRVPEGYLFVMGDNRFNSSDSRVWGFVDAATVLGRAQVIYWSHDPNDDLFSGYRLGRIGHLLR